MAMAGMNMPMMGGDGMAGMSLGEFTNMPLASQTSRLFEMMQVMRPMMAMMEAMMPGMRDMQFMSPFFTSRAGDFFWLFKGARVESGGEFAGAIIGTLVFAAFTTIGSEAAKKVERQMIGRHSGGARFAGALVGGAAHAFRVALHYLAMLLIMTFNVWVFLAVVVGHGIGYAAYRLAGGMLGRSRYTEPVGHGSGALSKAADSSSDSDARAKEDCC
eukprot:TRINITY_DN1571_c1_g1_i2.p1 TRINITY_DN1571_c1_g1~~TRINITY_DN1571_c1_g1_i2.p1  ORF type:complete len:216 (-),score=83.87 TRINITY_DN1571_c1_g1_i2:666-1313(-)